MNNHYQIIDNWLKKEECEKIKKFMFSPNFPWYKREGVATETSNDGFSFVHLFYDQSKPNSDYINLIEPILKKLNFKAMVRVKANFYPPTPSIFEHGVHKDYEFEHKGFLFYLNSNDGFTRINNNKVESIENRACFFDPTVLHNSSTCTTPEGRLNININYF